MELRAVDIWIGLEPSAKEMLKFDHQLRNTIDHFAGHDELIRHYFVQSRRKKKGCSTDMIFGLSSELRTAHQNSVCQRAKGAAI